MSTLYLLNLYFSSKESFPHENLLVKEQHTLTLD